jgi:hypothetical protein
MRYSYSFTYKVSMVHGFIDICSCLGVTLVLVPRWYKLIG